MKKKIKRNLILIIVGTIFLLVGTILIVLYQNRSSMSDDASKTLKLLHEKIILDYLLIIAGSILLTIPFFDKFFISGYNLSEIKLTKSVDKKNDQVEKIKELEEKIKKLESEKSDN